MIVKSKTLNNIKFTGQNSVILVYSDQVVQVTLTLALCWINMMSAFGTGAEGQVNIAQPKQTRTPKPSQTSLTL